MGESPEVLQSAYVGVHDVRTGEHGPVLDEVDQDSTAAGAFPESVLFSPLLRRADPDVPTFGVRGFGFGTTVKLRVEP